MALSAGNADLNTGLAGAIFAQLKTLPGAQFSGVNSPMAQFANALATAIIPYLTANAQIPGAPNVSAGSPGIIASGTACTGYSVLT